MLREREERINRYFRCSTCNKKETAYENSSPKFEYFILNSHLRIYYERNSLLFSCEYSTMLARTPSYLFTSGGSYSLSRCRFELGCAAQGCVVRARLDLRVR
jgi:hypothetical protein